MAKTKLTKIQMKFCEEYIKDYNATQAYLRASPDANYDTAKSKGCNILKMPLAQDYLTVLEQELYKEKRINAEHIANELADIAFADPTGAEGLTYQMKMKALELLQKQLGLQQQSIKANVNTNDICITIGNNLEKKANKYMSIKLNLDSTLFTPKAYPVITDYSHRWEFWYGGAGSAKSYSIAQKLIIRACSEQIKILVCRRYGSTIRNTCFALFKEILEYWKLTPYITIRESDFNIKFPNGSEIIHCGLDEETKLLSLQGIGTIWVEEAFEVSKDIVEQLNLRMRSQNKNQQLILSWNPISQSHWLFDFVEVNPPKNSVKYHSTFKDNPFLSEEYIEALEDMKIRNPAKARIYYYGEWGLDPEGLVITNFEVKEFNPMELAEQKLEHRAGADLGWIDPTAIVDSLYDRENKIIYVFNEFYKSGQQLDNVVQAIKNMNLEKTKIYMDSAEPRSVAYFKSLGFNVVPSIKGKDSVKAGITFLQNHKIVVLPSCQKIIMELSNFSYKKDKMGEYQEDCYTHEYSHAIDALRYAYSDIYTRTKLKTFEKVFQEYDGGKK